MAEQTNIEWCDATFNPWIGCTRVSPACDDCYAARSTPARTLGVAWGAYEPRKRTSDANWALPRRWAKTLPAKFGRRPRVFCASLADVFDGEVPPAWRADLFELIRVTPELDWLLLTKRPQNIVRMVRSHGAVAGNGTRYLPDNAWLGTTVEDQHRAGTNVPALLRCRAELGARVLFLSVEPMLEAIDVVPYIHCDIANTLDWVICGGESGAQARPMHPDWARSLRDQCAAAGTAFLFKQWGEWADMRAAGIVEDAPVTSRDGEVADWMRREVRFADGRRAILVAHSWTGHATDLMYRVGKKAAGRLLDGRTHDAFPTGSA